VPRTTWSNAHGLSHTGKVIRPSHIGKSGDQRGTGEIIEQEVQRRSCFDLRGKFSEKSRSQIPAGPAADQALEPGVFGVALMLTISRPLPVKATSGNVRARCDSPTPE